jgi:hypothetical protein
VTARRSWTGRRSGPLPTASTPPPPSRPEPGPGSPVPGGPPQRTPLPGPGPRAGAPNPEPRGTDLRVVLVSRDNMLAGALRSLIEAPGGVRMLDWHSQELDAAIRHADVVIIDMPPSFHERTFRVLGGRFLGRTVVLLQEGEHAEALPPGPPRVVLFRPLQIGELWSALTGSTPPSPAPEVSEAATAAPAEAVELPPPDTETPAPASPTAPPEAPRTEVEAGAEAGEPEVETGAAAHSAPVHGADEERGSEPAREPADDAATGGEAGAAAAAEPPAQGLPVSESGRLIGLSGRELEPMVGPGQVAPGLDEAALERLHRWRSSVRQPPGTREAPSAEPRGAGAAREDARTARAGRAEARRTARADAKAAREAARAEAARTKAAEAEARRAAREEARRAKAAEAEAREAERAAAAEARRLAEEESRRVKATEAEARRAAEEEARRVKAAEAKEREAERAVEAEARKVAEEEARRVKAAEAEARKAARTASRQEKAAQAAARREEAGRARAERAETRRSARAEAARARAERVEARRAARAERAGTRKAARAEARQARAAKAEVRRAARSEARQAAEARAVERREQARRESAARSQARQAARAEARQARAARAERRRTARAEASRAADARAERRRAAWAAKAEERKTARAARAEQRKAARAQAAQARKARTEQRRAARAEAYQARLAEAEVRKVADAEARQARATQREAKRAESRQARAVRAEARAGARAEARQARATRAEARRATREEAGRARATRRAESRQARAARSETRKVARAEARTARAARAETRRAEARQARAARAEQRQTARAEAGQARAARAEARRAARAEAGQARSARAEARKVARGEARQARAAKAEARKVARGEARQVRAAQAEARRTARAEAGRVRAARRAEEQAARTARRAEAQTARTARRQEAAAARTVRRAELRRVWGRRVVEARRVWGTRGAAGWAAVGRGVRAGVVGLARPVVVVVALAAVGLAVSGWRAGGGPDTLAGEVATVRAGGAAEGGLVAQDPRGGPIEPLHTLAAGAWLRASDAGSSIEAAVRAARAPSRWMLATAVALTVVLSLLLMRVGPGSGAAAGPGPAPPQPAGGAATLRRLGVAAVAGVLVALDPLLIRGGRAATGTVLALALALAALALAWAVPERPVLRRLAAVAAAGGLALLVSPLALPVLAVPTVAALLEGRHQEAWRTTAALGLAVGLWLLLPAWVAGHDLGAGQAGWLLGRPPGRGSVAASLAASPLSWLLVAAGLVAAILTWRPRSGARPAAATEAARRLAWAAATTGGALAAMALGYPVDRALPFAVPAGAVALAFAAGSAVTAARGRRARRLALAGTGVALAGLLVVQGVDWGARYGGRDDGLGRLVAAVAAQVPACSAVNAAGPDDRARLLAAGVTVTDFTSGPAAHAAGVRYFVLTGDTGGGPAAPGLAAWVRQRGDRLAGLPSRSFPRVELWRVDAAPLDPVADRLPVPGGIFSNVAGSACGGYRVVDRPEGAFHAGYEAAGGKAVLGRPLGSVWTSDGPALQAFDTMVLGAAPASGDLPEVGPIELPPLLAKLNAEAVADADIPLPSVRPPVTDRQAGALLDDRMIARAYLGTDPAAATAEDWSRARERFGRPLGRPQVMPDGAVRQPFERVVLELPADGGAARPAALGRLAVRLGLVPRQATRLEPVPGLPAGPAPIRLDPAPLLRWVALLTAALALAAGVAALAARRPGRPHPGGGEPGH